LNRQTILPIVILIGLILFGCFNVNGLFIILQIVDTGSILYDSVMVRITIYIIGIIMCVIVLLYYLWRVKGQAIDTHLLKIQNE
jgi:hypothetical protein